jgi:ABC-type branched-chain amino acid transport systems, periplasmic component
LEVFVNMKIGRILRASLGLGALSLIAPLAFAEQTVLIGSVGPLTGNIAHLGKDAENGAQLAIEEANAKGVTIGGQTITLKLDVQDDAADPRTATQVAQKLVDDKVVGVVGHVNSGTSIPASRIYNDAGVVEISPSATNPAYTLQGFKSTYRVVATDAQQGPALANYAVKTLKLKSVAVIDDSTAYGQGFASEFEKTAKAIGLSVLSHDASSDKAVDFKAILTKIKSENPDAIVYGGVDGAGGGLVKQARQLGIKAKIFAGDGMCTEMLPQLAGEAVMNVVCSQPSVALEKMPGGAAFQTRYVKRFGQPIQTYAPYAYDAVNVIVDAMKRAGSTSPQQILAAMPTTDYKGVIGTISFDSKGDLAHGAVSIFLYVEGKKSLLSEVRL